MNMPMPSERKSEVEVITGVQRRRRWAPEQKLEWVRKTMEPSMSVSLVAREAGSTASQLFQWRPLDLHQSRHIVTGWHAVVEAIMMGSKLVPRERTKVINLEEFVPHDHLLRTIDRYLDAGDIHLGQEAA